VVYLVTSSSLAQDYTMQQQCPHLPATPNPKSHALDATRLGIARDAPAVSIEQPLIFGVN
jgi:hypothetical protein